MKKRLREFLAENHLDALLITRTDSFLGEYFPPESTQLKQATGFSGSAGLAIITPDEAVLFVDSRYTEQAKIETDWTVFEIPTQTTPSDWMERYVSGKIIGYNPWYRSAAWLEYMTQKGLKFDPVDWQKWQLLFPNAPDTRAPVFDYGIEYCGETTESKIKRLVSVLKEHDLDAYVLTSPDSVSYLLNKRSLTVPEYPVIFERLVVFTDGTYRELPDDMACLKGKRVGIDFMQAPVAVCRKINRVVSVKNLSDPVEKMKSIKNTVEQNNIRKACLFESRVLCRFLVWVERHKTEMDELDCDAKLKELRAETPLYRGDSFPTIAAVGAHAACAHYIATDKTTVPLTSAPMFLVDTGGNYLNGTTDMTRTICVGQPTALMKKRYTQVLKGHIALATTAVKDGDMPAKLDQNARSFLRADGVDYGHSTGHGIGMYLAVHEAPPTIYEKAVTPLHAGMLFSNEPAFYDMKDGFGIRLENMILTLAGPDNSLILENLLWIPFDGRLIEVELLTDSEKAWLKAYHQGIVERILPDLSDSEKHVLEPILDFFLNL